MQLSLKKRSFLNITLFRALLAFIVFLVLISNKKPIALYLFLFAAFLSFFERFVVKKEKSALRSIFDVLADKLLVNLTAFTLVFQGLIPFWVAAIFLARDILTVVGGVVLILRDKHHVFTPTLLGKVMLFFQIVSLIPPLFSGIDWVLTTLAIVFTVVSALELVFTSEFKLQKKSDLGQFFKIGELVKLADLFTLLNVVFGLGAIILAIEDQHTYSMILLFLAAIFDFFDGKIARALKQQNVFGKELDSLADTISFGVAPAVIGFTLVQGTLPVIAFTIFLFCGILRLARFNIMQSKDSFEGMPITLTGILIPLIYFVQVPFQFYPYLYLGLGILMISSIKFKKWG